MTPQVREALDRLGRRIQSVLARAVLRAVSEDKGLRLIAMDLLSEEAMAAVEHWEGYGVTARPSPGAEPLVGFFGGQRGHPVAFAVADRRYRPRDLADGEVKIYAKWGQNIHLLDDGSIKITTAGGQTALHLKDSETVLTTPNFRGVKT